MHIREALDQLELMSDLAALVCDLLLGSGVVLAELFRHPRMRDLRFKSVGTGTLFQRDLRSRYLSHSIPISGPFIGLR